MQAKRPNFFVVGAPKCGTSSLYAYLGQHPDFFVAARKEPHFFSQPAVAESYYPQQRIDNLQDYLALYRNWGNETWAGDFSPSYLYYGRAAHKVFAFRPDARILMILRNPVTRAVSHYLMDRRMGLQSKPLADILARPEDYPAFYREYVEVGRYARQVETWRNLFGDRARVMLYEDLKRDTTAFVGQVLKFLDMDPHPIDTETAHGAYRMPRSHRVERFRQSRLWRRVKGMVPDGLKDRIKPMLDDHSKPDFSTEEAALWRIFCEDTDRLADLLNMDLSHWKAADG
ncbi:MAG: sulfotransferase [Acidobacteriota bacterium]|nr:sulfotransferase [Acidobacteriota bacterium]